MQDYTYYFVAAPWLCVKLMKLLQCFPTPGEDTHHLTHPFSPPYRSLTHTHPLSLSLTHSLSLSLSLSHSLSLSLSLLSEDPIVKSRLAEAIDAILTKAQVMSSIHQLYNNYVLYYFLSFSLRNQTSLKKSNTPTARTRCCLRLST